jgi:hypothetical protein
MPLPSPPFFSQVWGHVDTDADGRISYEEYTLAMGTSASPSRP